EGDVQALDTVIELRREALAFREAPHPDRRTSLTNVAVTLLVRFKQRGSIQDLDEALENSREGLELYDSSHKERDMQNLEECISVQREALTVCAAAIRSGTLNNLANVLRTLFELTGHAKDLDEAAELQKEALDLSGALDPNLSAYLNNMATILHKRFELRGDAADLSGAVKFYREALVLRSVPHPERSTSLHSLANALHTTFDKFGDIDDIDKAIELLEEALAIIHPTHPLRPLSLDKLASVLATSFEHRGDLQAINRAVELHHEALALCNPSHVHFSTALDNLGKTLQIRFKQLKDLKDVNSAIACHQQALAARASSHPDKADSLNNFADALHLRFQYQEGLRDINQSIELHRQAVSIVSPLSRKHRIFVENLGSALQTRYIYSGDLKDIEEAIDMHEGVLLRLDSGHPDRCRFLNNFAMDLYARFNQQQDSKDLDLGIKLSEEALALCDSSHRYRGKALNILANALRIRSDNHGTLNDFDMSIKLHREALILHRSSGHPDCSKSLDQLSIALYSRFIKRSGTQDLNEAIELQGEALSLNTLSPAELGRSRNNLAITLIERFELSMTLKDIDVAIELLEKVLVARGSHPERVRSLNILADALRTRFKQQKVLKDLDRVVELHQEAVTLSTSSQEQKANSLCGLANALHSRFKHWEKADLEDILKAIDIQREALALWSAPHPVYLHSLFSLADILVTLYEQTGDTHNLDEAVSAFQEAATHESSPPFVRIRVLRRWATTAAQYGHRSALTAYRTLFTLIPQLVPLHLDILSRQQMLQNMYRTRLASDAAACAVGLGQYNTAVELLETSRSIFWAQALHLRTPLDSLAAVNPQLATKLLDLSKELEKASFRDTHRNLEHDTQNKAMSIEAEGVRSRLFGGRENFVNKTPDEVFRMYLADLWTTIVKPVFDAMDLKAITPRRLWWCPVGNFAFIPVHAAGVYGSVATDCASDYVISSYTPTLTALLDPLVNSADHFKMTAIIEPNAPNSAPLPGAKVELQKIQARVPTQWLSIPDEITVASALHHLRQSTIVHFACHGVQDLMHPLNSGLLLSDGRLKVPEIMHQPDESDPAGIHKSLSLAFLSACETAKGEQAVPDESMHLAATLLFSGFSGVVGTMWALDDRDGPKIADAFYEYLFRNCDASCDPPALPDLTRAAEALHFAVGVLRKEAGISFKRWVPFVHFGL
ncbi:mucin-like protein 1, partial [Mycena pura]